MEPLQPGTGASQPPQPAWAWPTPIPAAPARPRRSHKPYLAVRAGADRRLVVGAVAGGVFFDIAARGGLATIAGTAWVGVAAAAILLGGRIRGLASRLAIGAAPVLGLILTFRSNPWVLAPVTFAVALLLFLGVSLGADGSGLSTTFPALNARIAIALGHLAFAPGMFRSQGEPAPGGVARRRAVAVGRGALLGVPVMIIVGLLLALADPIFRSWFDLTAVVQHLVLASIGAWAVVGLFRAASAAEPSPSLPSAASLGTVEAAFVLSGLCALYAAFVDAQFVALSGAGHHILVTQGLTYAQYARSGFFQLLACAAITLLVLLGVRACANPAHPVLIGLSGLTVVLTIGVVVVAIRRLQLYEAEFGLTMLRLACLVAAAWIGIVFVLLGSTVPRRGLSRRYFPTAVIISGLIFVGIWSISNPASIVARTNLRRAEHGQSFDVSQVASLGPDAVPSLLADLRYLDASQAIELRHAICARSAGKAAGPAFNMTRFRANGALARACASPGRSG
jgi:Domain of unknown function (DUF4173)